MCRCDIAVDRAGKQDHPDSQQARQSIQEVIESYRRIFEQQSVLWESARVCGAF